MADLTSIHALKFSWLPETLILCLYELITFRPLVRIIPVARNPEATESSNQWIGNVMAKPQGSGWSSEWIVCLITAILATEKGCLRRLLDSSSASAVGAIGFNVGGIDFSWEPLVLPLPWRREG